MALCKEACNITGGIYRPRNPRASPLYQCVVQHYEELEGGGHFSRPVEEQVLTRFLDCGDLHQGFACIYCDNCGHDYLLAYGEWEEENLLAPVLHRQYVFALPKLLRPWFRHDHALVADGVFYPSGSFHVLPPLPEDVLTESLRHRVMDYLCKEASFAPELAQRMRQWQHSGFSVDNQIRVNANDTEGRKRLGQAHSESL